MVNWNSYLESICNKYAQWWQVYTLTDVEGRQQAEVEALRLLDFMVETVQPHKGKPSQKQEKIERLGVLEGLRKYAKEHVLLVGRPGSGKSTALVRLLLEEAEKSSGAGERQAKIPVLVELRYYQTSVLDLIQHFFKRHRLLLDIAVIEQLLFDGRLLLLVDGINELPSDDARRDLKKFREDYPATPMIFTTRDLGVGGDLGIVKKLEMQPLTNTQMRDFVNKYLPEQGDRMLQQLGDRLREFGQTPLLLMILCSVFKAKGDVPPNLGLVFRQFTQIYDEKLKQDVAVTDESRRWWRLLLEHLAFRMTQGRKLTDLQVAIPRQEAEEILTEFLRQEGFDKPRDRALCWLQDLLNHHLIQPGVEDKIEFRHQLIQEYYTAESLLKRLPDLSDDCLKREYLNYLKWTEPLALMLALVNDEAQAVRVVKLAIEVDLKLGARLAGSVKLEFQTQTVTLVAELEIPQKVKIELLGITRSDRAILTLLPVLNDKDSDVRNRTARVLGEIGNEAAVSALREALMNHEDYIVRWWVTEALKKIGNKAAVQALLQALKDEDFVVRSGAAEALKEIGNEAAVPELLQALKHEDAEVCSMAAKALGGIGNEAAVRSLQQALKHQDSEVRFRAAGALGEIGNEAAVPALIQALNDEEDSVCFWAAEALGKIGNQEAVQALLQVLNDKHSRDRSGAAYALGYIGNAEAVQALLRALKDEDFVVCGWAARALGNVGNEAAVRALLQVLTNNHEDFVRIGATYALRQLGNKVVVPELLPALLQALKDKNDEVRLGAAGALGEIGNKAAVPALREALLNDECSIVRSSAAEALGKIRNEAAVPALRKALNDKDSDVSSSAADALANIGSPKLLPDLPELLQTTGEGNLFNTIAAIQERCKYYNYTLTQSETALKPQPNTPPAQSIPVSVMHILHLSDLHFGTTADANNWYGTLAEDLKSNDLNCHQLDALILSGDITNKSTEEEYNAAEKFVTWLAAEFQIKRSHIIIVPGNHDLNWELGDKAYSYENDILKRDQAQHQRRFDNFRNFYQAIKQESYPLEYEHQGILYHLPKQKLLVLGLNSAWKLDRIQKNDANIKSEALTNALNKIRDNEEFYKDCLKIAVWHHPLNSSGEDRIKDYGFMERLAQNGFRLALHGHIHKAENSLYSYDRISNSTGRKLNIICAGTFGAPVREWVPGYPLQYNLLKFEDNKLKVNTRRREELNGAWKPDARWLMGAGQNPLPYYEIPLFAE